MSDNIVGRSIVQYRVTHLELRPLEPKLLTLVILHNNSKMTWRHSKKVPFAYNGLVFLLAVKKSSLRGDILLTRRAHV